MTNVKFVKSSSLLCSSHVVPVFARVLPTFVPCLLVMLLVSALAFGVQDEQEEHSFDDEHTPGNPYCGDITCWCHNDSDYHEVVIDPDATDEEIGFAFSFFGVEVGQ